jgi:nicotinate-nucleotide adenylyltransferase
MKIGLYGGTFDPIHKGHLHLAKQVQEHHGLDRVLWVPALSPPHKPGKQISSFEHRCTMLELAIRSENLQEHVVSHLEAERPGPSYTVDTLALLKQQYPHGTFFLLMGSDMSATFSSWYKWEQILSWATPVILVRKGMEATLDPELPHKYATLMQQSILPVETVPISSTQIREATQQGKSLSNLVSPEVETYIQEMGLYL